MEITERILKNALDNNPYFSAGAGLFGMGMAVSVLRKSSQYLNLFVKRNFTLTLEVPSHDRCYPWVLSWIYVKSKLRRGAGQHLSVDTQLQTSQAGKLMTNFDFIPSTGIHYILHNRKVIQVERVRSAQTLQGAKAAPFESLTLKTIGTDAKFFTNLLEEAKDLAVARDEGSTVIYKAYGHEWRQFGHPKRKRPLDSVILSSFTNESIVADLNEFIKSENWYLSRGIPYRRGYMFHGPPGCGKSSLITSLAGYFDFSLCVVSLSEIGMSSDRLDYLLTHAPYRSFIVIEDVDAALPSREAKDVEASKLPQYSGMTNVTMSGLLNALDGVASSEGRILFMTTNYIEKLDPALIRPGRVDRVFLIGLCDLDQLRKMLVRFYTDITPQQIEDIVLKIGPNRISPAQFQGHLLKHKENVRLAFDNLDEFLSVLDVKSADR